jgi:hypothetical protein
MDKRRVLRWSDWGQREVKCMSWTGNWTDWYGSRVGHSIDNVVFNGASVLRPASHVTITRGTVDAVSMLHPASHVTKWREARVDEREINEVNEPLRNAPNKLAFKCMNTSVDMYCWASGDMKRAGVLLTEHYPRRMLSCSYFRHLYSLNRLLWVFAKSTNYNLSVWLNIRRWNAEE